MKHSLYTMAIVALAAMAISSCDEDTQTVGSSVTNASDELIVTDTTYYATTRTVVADSVLSLSNSIYLGRVKDPETGADVTCEFSTQFHLLEQTYIIPEEKIVNQEDARALADSCDLVLYLDSPFKSENNLTAMKIRIRELAQPMAVGRRYYSNYDPVAEGMIKNGGLDKSKMISYTNMTVSDEERTQSSYLNNVRITLNEPYLAADGVTYANYGSYIMRQYYDHPEYFHNSLSFANNVCAGLFFEVTDGMGFYSQVSNIGLRVYYTFQGDTAVANGQLTLAATQEVTRTLHVKNDMDIIRQLADVTTHTYLKSPAGLFTEVTLPVADIKEKHSNDSLIATKIVFQRENNQSFDSRTFSIPNTLLMVQRDSLYTYFEKNRLPDNVTSYVSTYAASNSNCYTFSNISNLITELWRVCEEGMASDDQWETNHPNWNKVVLVPVSLTTASSSVTNVENAMNLASTRLVGGETTPIGVSVVYAKYK